MRSGKVFWGLFILILGIVLLLEPLGIIPAGVNIWRFVLPAFLIFLGIWALLVPSLYKGKRLDMENLSIPLEEASQASLKLRHGAGRLEVFPLESADTFLAGEFGGGVDKSVLREGKNLRVKLSAPHIDFFPDPQFEGLNWQIKLNRGVATRLDVHSGASETNLNLEDLQINELNVETGASSTNINLPSNAGFTHVSIDSGAASVIIRVPSQVAARIHVESGLAGISIDKTRFIYNGREYESSGYAEAINKADIYVKTGVGSLEVI